MVREETSFNELLIFFSKQFCRQPTVICLIKRAPGNLINFQVVVKKRLSMFELLKCCCRIFQQRLLTDFVSDQRAQVLQRIFFPLQNELLCSRALPYNTLSREKGVNFSYDTFQTFGVFKQTSNHRRYYHPQSNTYRKRRLSPNKRLPQMYEFPKIALPEQTALASRAGKATRVGSQTVTGSYEVLL